MLILRQCWTAFGLFVGFSLLVWPALIQAASSELPPTLGSSRPRLLQARTGSTTRPGLPDLRIRPQLPRILFRGDSRTPEQLKELGGIPTEFSGPTTNESYSLNVHHLGLGRVASAYTSTSRSLGVAFAYGINDVSNETSPDPLGDGLLYRISATPNMIDMDASGVTLVHESEQEFSCLGGVRWDQVEAWIFIRPGMIEGFSNGSYIEAWPDFESFLKDVPAAKWIENPDHNGKMYPLAPSPGQPQLAGGRTSLEKSQGKSLEQSAIDFMGKSGLSVGWNGSFPLDLKAKVGLKDESAEMKPPSMTPAIPQASPEKSEAPSPKSRPKNAGLIIHRPTPGNRRKPKNGP